MNQAPAAEGEKPRRDARLLLGAVVAVAGESTRGLVLPLPSRSRAAGAGLWAGSSSCSMGSGCRSRRSAQPGSLSIMGAVSRCAPSSLSISRTCQYLRSVELIGDRQKMPPDLSRAGKLLGSWAVRRARGHVPRKLVAVVVRPHTEGQANLLKMTHAPDSGRLGLGSLTSGKKQQSEQHQDGNTNNTLHDRESPDSWLGMVWFHALLRGCAFCLAGAMPG